MWLPERQECTSARIRQVMKILTINFESRCNFCLKWCCLQVLKQPQGCTSHFRIFLYNFKSKCKIQLLTFQQWKDCVSNINNSLRRFIHLNRSWSSGSSPIFLFFCFVLFYFATRWWCKTTTHFPSECSWLCADSFECAIWSWLTGTLLWWLS